MGDIPLDLNQSPANINFNFNVSFDGRWTSNLDHLSTLGRLWDTQSTLGVLLLKH